ncbi:hypothetical protein C0Q70_07774 [Pomacea canaliculata]|uniref:Ionotropic glutamate receptor L-glutamate and glycine-binding domain-containing protein n=1 Tax=Pomacea canaliculata TaxID=400727 RepID=A0A2T7PG19_POMCA|nr:hypothetical protein C0Q70_07774 [Pomacea canaliculata]
MLLPQREMLAVSCVLWTLVLTQPHRVCQSGVSRDRISANQALREVIGLLGWLEVTVISNSHIGNASVSQHDADADMKDLTDDLTAASLAVLEVDVGLSQIAQLDLATLPTHNVVVVGSTDFVTGVQEELSCGLYFERERSAIQILVLAAPHYGPRSFFLFKSKETEAYEGVVMDMLTEIARKLNFSYVLLQSPDGTWGEVNANNEWTGAIGMLTRNTWRLDSSLSSPERSKVADASSAFFYDNARILFRKRKQAQEPRSVFLGTFTGPLYLLLAGLFLGVVVMLTFIEWCAWCLQANPTAAPTTRRRFLSRTLAGTEGMLAGLLNQCTFSLWLPLFLVSTCPDLMNAGENLFHCCCPPAVALKLDSRAGSVLMCSWMIFCVVLTSIYSSKLTSSLAVTDQALPFASLSELVRQKTYKWGIAAGTAKESILKSSPVEEHRAFYNGVLEFEKTDPDVHSSDLQVHKAKVLHEAYAFFTGARDLYDEWHKDIPEITMVSVDYFLTRKGFYLQKGSPYKTQVSYE